VARGRTARFNLIQPLQIQLREGLFRLSLPWALAARRRAFAAGEASPGRPPKRPPAHALGPPEGRRDRPIAAPRSSARFRRALAAQFTQGELTALAVVARQFQQRQVCVLCVDQTAALAGICGRLDQKTVRAAEAAGLVHIRERRIPGQISLPNVVTIVSKEWLNSLRRGAGVDRVKFVSRHGYESSFQVRKSRVSGHGSAPLAADGPSNTPKFSP
jgi:hypothetical protein